MRASYLLPAAYLLDSIAGDPEWLPHPVRLLGTLISKGEQIIRRPTDTPAAEFAKGTLMTVALVLSSYCGTAILIRKAYRSSEMLGSSVEILLAWTCLAAHNLQQEALSVNAALERGELQLARLRLARVVGRDTHALDASEISRALIETLAESASDGIIAPIFYMTAGGVPLAMAYKALNTLDSMIGHREVRYLFFGKCAARLDDIFNLVPSRMTALCLVCAAALTPNADAEHAWKTWLRDANKHSSPNAGHPEAAMAGALEVKLGGANHYDGRLVVAQKLGDNFPSPAPAQIRAAMRLVARAACIGLFVGIIYTTVKKSRAA